MDWRAEAEAHGRDVRGGVAELRLDEAATTQDGATLVITMRVHARSSALPRNTLQRATHAHPHPSDRTRPTPQEGSTRTIRVSMDGCQEVCSDGSSHRVFDSLHSLLLNTSDGYKQHFNDSLRASLQALVDAQEAEM